jgi:hydrogenase maturation protease
MRALIGGVGYPDLSDHSVGWVVVEQLERMALPTGVIVEDASYNPVALAQRLDDGGTPGRFDTIVLVSAVERGREPGTVTAYRWDLRLPPDEEIHRSVTDAVTGIIHLDNTLVVTRHLASLPDRVAVIEVQPLVEGFATPMSDVVRDNVDRICADAVRYASDPAAFDALPTASLGGPKVRPPIGDAPDEQADDLLEIVQRAIDRLRRHVDPDVRAEVEALLAGIDAVHRTALGKLVSTLQSMGGDALMTRLVADPAIRLLLMSYDLIAVDRRLMAEEALDTVRGHLHAHGVDVELIDVLGGVVYVQFHGLENWEGAEGLVRQDVARALRDGLLGFQQLEIGARRPTASGGSVFVPLEGLRLNRPVLQTAARTADIPPGTLHGAIIGEHPVLLANVNGEFHAVSNRCGDSPLPLQFGTLQDHVLTCSWHGCQYDTRTGRRLDRPGPGLTVYPVRLSGDEVQVAIAVTAASAPS